MDETRPTDEALDDQSLRMLRSLGGLSAHVVDELLDLRARIKAVEAERDEEHNEAEAAWRICEEFRIRLQAAELRATEAERQLQWQDISTAAKDRRPILAASNGDIYAAMWARDRWRIFPLIWQGGDRGDFARPDEEPTHWRPLPSPPRHPRMEANNGR